MSKTKAVLIIGSGFVGTHLALKLRQDYKVFTTYFTRPVRIPGVTSLKLSVANTPANMHWVKRVVYAANPEIVIYAAGENSWEWAERNPQDAAALHSAGPGSILSVADILQPRFIFLSNGLVFDGGRGNYHEGETVLPSTALGKAKVGGENFVRGRSLHHIIIRSGPLLGRGNGFRRSLVDRLRMKLDRGERVELSASELHTFAPVSGLVDMVVRVMESGMRQRTFHYGGLTKLSYYDLGVSFAKRFNYDPRLIVPAAPRPDENQVYDFTLNCTAATQELKIQPLLLEQSLDLLDQELIPRL